LDKEIYVLAAGRFEKTTRGLRGSRNVRA
jgi:hypothetical protein